MSSLANSFSEALPPRVLVTGASGFIATRLIYDLLRVTTDDADGRATSFRVRGTVRGAPDSPRYDQLHQLARSAIGGDEARLAGLWSGDLSERFELVSLDLTEDAGWNSAVEGCDYVLHLASPFPLNIPADAEEVVRPAVNGTRRLMEACRRSRSIKRLVLTSSSAAVSGGGEPSRSHRPPDHVFTESDWSDPALCPAYERSKTLAEKTAWEAWHNLTETERFELVVLNPVLVVGPLLLPNPSPSVVMIMKLFSGEYPAVPCLYPNLVDVRDVSRAHLQAMTLPGISGHRFILSSEGEQVLSLPEISIFLQKEYGHKGYRLPAYTLPRWVASPMRLVYPELKLAYPFLDVKCYYDVQKAMDTLALDFIPVKASLLDLVQSMEDHDLIKPKQWLSLSRLLAWDSSSDADHQTSSSDHGRGRTRARVAPAAQPSAELDVRKPCFAQASDVRPWR